MENWYRVTAEVELLLATHADPAAEALQRLVSRDDPNKKVTITGVKRFVPKLGTDLGTEKCK